MIVIPELFLKDTVSLYHGDSREVLKSLADCSIDSVVCDPPYALVSIVKRFGADNAAPATPKEGAAGAYARAPSGFMGKTWDTGETAFAVEFWAEVMRVLKPGGHVVAASGTRTYHRLACAIEDAGFEIRDQIQWLYGTGFPKSHDVSKAIDKAAGAKREVTPTAPMMTGTEIGRISKNLRCAVCGRPRQCHSPCVCPRDSGPATESARQWQGWGTALKPACEPWVLARKPLMSKNINVIYLVEAQLRERGVNWEISWKSENVSGATKKKSPKNSLSTNLPQAAETCAVNAEEKETQIKGRQIETHSEQSILNGERQTEIVSGNITSESAMNCAMRLLTPMAGSAVAVENLSATSSLSTTSTAAAQPTEKQFTGRSTASFGEKDSHRGTGCFAGIATGLTGSMAHVHIKLDMDGLFIWPQGLPKHVAGSPLTVAANVLQHGTGAINVDGCRVETEEDRRRNAKGGDNGLSGSNTFKIRDRLASDQPDTSGRFPANVIHDGSDEVVGMFPETASGSLNAGHKRGSGVPSYDGGGGIIQKDYGDDSGSAARFFYSAKADKGDRLGSKHPTVKPVDLMQYLCRLVTPPGGVVLDPFAGTGTTGEAAWREGFRAVLIEREPEYAADIRRRMALAAASPRERKQESIKARGNDEDSASLPLFKKDK